MLGSTAMRTRMRHQSPIPRGVSISPSRQQTRQRHDTHRPENNEHGNSVQTAPVQVFLCFPEFLSDLSGSIPPGTLFLRLPPITSVISSDISLEIHKIHNIPLSADEKAHVLKFLIWNIKRLVLWSTKEIINIWSQVEIFTLKTYNKFVNLRQISPSRSIGRYLTDSVNHQVLCGHDMIHNIVKLLF